MSKIKGKTTETFSEEQIFDFINSISQHRYRTAFLLMLTAGLSARELVGLRWQDLNSYCAFIQGYGTFKNGVYEFTEYDKFNSKFRVVPLITCIAEELYLLKQERIKDKSVQAVYQTLVFLTDKGKPYQITDLIRNFNRLYYNIYSPQMCILQNTAKMYMYNFMRLQTVSNLCAGTAPLNISCMSDISLDIIDKEIRKAIHKWNIIINNSPLHTISQDDRKILLAD